MSLIEIKHSYKVPAENVFDAFLSAKSMQEFMFRTPTGMVVEASCDGEAGGNFVLVENRNGQMAGHYGTFMEVDRPERLTFVFTTEKDSDSTSYVELNFEKKSGATEVTLSTELPPELESMKSKMEGGWKGILEGLETYLNKSHAAANVAIPKDSNGQILEEGDSVKTIKDLKVKGSSMVVKRGTIVRKIHLISGNDEEVDCKVDGVALALETQWLVKV